jgi:putative spermidine/putrescine transport system permease protein
MDHLQGIVLSGNSPQRAVPGLGRAVHGLGRAVPGLVLVGLVVVVPAVVLTTYAFRDTTFLGVGPGPTLDQFRKLVDQPTFWNLTPRTIGVGLIVGPVVTLLSFVMAYGIRFRFSRRAGRRILAVVIAAGIASFLVRIFAWGTVLNANGLVNHVLMKLGIIDNPFEPLFYSSLAVVITMVYLYLPIGIAIMFGALQDIDQFSVEAGRDLGAGRWRTALQLVAPQAAGAITTCFVLTTVLASADYVTPQLVGGTKGIMIGVAIRDRALSGADLPGAAATTIAFLLALAVVLAVVVLLIRVCRLLVRPLAPIANRVATRAARHAPRWMERVSLSRAATILLAFYLILPTVVVFVFSFNSARTLGLPWQGFTTKWYPDVVSRPGFGESLRTSLLVAIVASAAATMVGGAMASAATRTGPRTRRLIQAAALLPFVVPGILIGLGLMIAADASPMVPGYSMTVVAHVVLLLPVVMAVLLTRLMSLNPEFVQAARDLGARQTVAFRTITFPLILPSVLAAFVLCFTISMDEIFVTVFTIGSSTTLPIWILSQARVGFDPGLNALGVMLVTATVVLPLVIYGVARLGTRLLGHRRPAESEGAELT